MYTLLKKNTFLHKRKALSTQEQYTELHEITAGSNHISAW